MKMTSRFLKVLLFILIFLILTNFMFCFFYYPSEEEVRVKVKLLTDLRPALQEGPSEMKEKQSKNISEEETLIHKEMCPEIPPGLGPTNTNLSILHPITRMTMNVRRGGVNKLYGCEAQERAAIVIPMPHGTTKSLHFRTLLYYLHHFLMSQQLEYQIFVVEQSNLTEGYNRGMLLNAAFTEIHRRFLENRFPCIIIQDPNLVPVDTRNLYRCSWYPRQLAMEVQLSDETTIEPIFGGAVAISHEQYVNANGFPNTFWNDNSDFEDMYNRLLAVNYTIEHTPNVYGNYTTLKLVDEPLKMFDETQSTSVPNIQDGLTPLSYIVLHYELRDIYTYIRITYPKDNDSDVTAPFNAVWSKLQDIMSELTTTAKPSGY